MFVNDKQTGIWTTRLRAPGRSPKKVSLGTTLKTAAAACEAWCRSLERRLDAGDVLAAIVDGVVSAADAYALDVEGVRRLLRERAEAATRRPLAPLVASWERARASGRGGDVRAAQYARSVRLVLPPGATTADLDPKAIRRWLAARDVKGSTRNRDKAALSSFCAWLADEGLLEENPVRDVEGFAEAPRLIWLTIPQAQQLVAAHTDAPAKLAACLAIGFGWEWSAVAAGVTRDVDLARGVAHAHGIKTLWRDRVCVLTEVMAWVRPILRDLLADRLPTAPLVPGLSVHGNLWRHYQAIAACAGAVPDHRYHDHRHTHAVNLLLAGESPQHVAHNLGLNGTQLVWTRYGRYAVRPEDFRTAVGDESRVLSLSTRVQTG